VAGWNSTRRRRWCPVRLLDGLGSLGGWRRYMASERIAAISSDGSSRCGMPVGAPFAGLLQRSAAAVSGRCGACSKHGRYKGPGPELGSAGTDTRRSQYGALSVARNPSSLRTLPYGLNPFSLGGELVLDQIHNPSTAAGCQTSAVVGMSGLGNSQLASMRMPQED